MTTPRPQRTNQVNSSSTTSAANAIKPKRVRGGKRIRSKATPVGESTLAHDWAQLIEAQAHRLALSEGFEYATLGQIVSFQFTPGSVHGRVQGRSRRPYHVRIDMPTWSDEEWDQLLGSFAGEARSVAALLEAKVTDHVLDQMRNVGHPLLPEDPDDLTFHCACESERESDMQVLKSPCKHIVAFGYVLAEGFDTSPMDAFILRGASGESFMDRLRMRRLIDLGGGTARALQSVDLSGAHPDGEADETGAMDSDAFWSVGPGLNEVTDDLIKPDLPAHGLLRRLGPSPLIDHSRFPLSGLLASCYDVIAESARLEQFGDADAEDPTLAEDDRSTS